MNPCVERACRVSSHRNYNELNPAGLSCVECTCIGETSFYVNDPVMRLNSEQRRWAHVPGWRSTCAQKMPTVDLPKVSSDNKRVVTVMDYGTRDVHTSLNNSKQGKRTQFKSTTKLESIDRFTFHGISPMETVGETKSSPPTETFHLYHLRGRESQRTRRSYGHLF
jgi:hypothetical protein